jgi:hypothetical protein
MRAHIEFITFMLLIIGRRAAKSRTIFGTPRIPNAQLALDTTFR